MTPDSIHNNAMRKAGENRTSRGNILVVDNHPVVLNMIANLLKKKGYKVLTAEDGLAALDILKWMVWRPPGRYGPGKNNRPLGTPVKRGRFPLSP
jgi:hypothetical protein